MKQRSGPAKQPAEAVVKDIRRATRRQFSAEEKIRIVLEGLRGEDSIAELCRREHAPGTIVISTRERRLYYVLGGGQAIQYGVGVGRPGFTWAGTKTVTMKREWPDWRPPAQMLRRRPDLPRYMAGGPDNPLGARAMYLGGSLYRIHGSNEPHTIGQAVSSGCIRMTNDDVEDLYDRVRVGTKVIVI
jgi:lipoprotein-anchoring transpeptidase ErfK/SrfK